VTVTGLTQDILTMRLNWIFAVWLLGVSLASAQTPPVIFFTDLTSGPNSHGENVGGFSGAYVTLYGNYFGSSQGSSKVTLNAANCLRVASWGGAWQWYQKIVVQLGPNCSSGNFVVTANGVVSNPIPFAVRSGHIYFVSPEGKDGNNGSFASPWKTIPHAVQTAGASAGNVIYVRNGVGQATDDGQGWRSALLLRSQWCKGTISMPNALLAYPGAIVTLGTTAGPDSAIRGTDSSGGGGACQGGWTFAGLQLRGTYMSIGLNGQSSTSPSSNWRIVGNDMTCPHGTGATACFEASFSSDLKAYGNNVHDTGEIGPPGASALYHGVYFSTDTNHVDFGWNTIANVRGCRGLQLHSTDGYGLYDYNIHDNVIHDTQCDGIVLATTNPSQGQVSVFNNLIYNAGKGPNNPEHTGAWNCIYLAAYTKKGPAGRGTIEVYGNTMYNCGSFASPPYRGSNNGVLNDGGSDPVKIHLQNNIIYQLNSSTPYFANGNPLPDGVYGENNVMYGIGKPPSNTYVTGTINGNPQFVNPGTDFHLSSAASPANGAGRNSSPLTTYDHDGVLRRSPPAVGAYEYAATPAAKNPTPTPIDSHVFEFRPARAGDFELGKRRTKNENKVPVVGMEYKEHAVPIKPRLQK